MNQQVTLLLGLARTLYSFDCKSPNLMESS